MRKSLWVSLIVLFVAIGAPNAYANSETPTFTCTGAPLPCLSSPTAPAVTFPGPTLDLTWDTLSVGEITFLYSIDSPSDTYTWVLAAYANPPFMGGYNISIFINDTTTLTQSYLTAAYSPTCPGCPNYPNFLEEEGNLSFAPTAAAPEPSSVALMLLGVGLVFVMRKRIGQRLPQAS